MCGIVSPSEMPRRFQQVLVGQNNLAHLARRQIARGPAFIEECDIERADATIADEFIDRIDEQVAKLLLR